MPTWNSRGLRGSFLEELVNMTNEKYQAQNLALVQKIPTPIKPINIDQETRHITLAYFEQKVPLTISVSCRAFQSVLMQKSASRTVFHLAMCMSIK